MIGDTRAMSKMNIVEVLAEFCDCQYASIRNITTLGQHDVAKTRSDGDDFLQAGIIELVAVCEIKNT